MQPDTCMACKSNVILGIASAGNRVRGRRTGTAKAISVKYVAQIFLLIGTTAAGLPVSGAEPAPAGCRDAPYRHFDFWLGRWEVALADGRRAGTNLIRATEDGCLIQERWTGAGGGRGHSMNFYEPGTGSWRQIWVSADSVIEISGGLEAESMVLEGRISYRASGAAHPFRGRWTLLDDGRVRQFFEERPETKWQPWFEGFYSKVVE